MLTCGFMRSSSSIRSAALGLAPSHTVSHTLSHCLAHPLTLSHTPSLTLSLTLSLSLLSSSLVTSSSIPILARVQGVGVRTSRGQRSSHRARAPPSHTVSHTLSHCLSHPLALSLLSLRTSREQRSSRRASNDRHRPSDPPPCSLGPHKLSSPLPIGLFFVGF